MPAETGARLIAAGSSARLTVPNCQKHQIMPIRKPKSPTLLTMNAFLDAELASFVR